MASLLSKNLFGLLGLMPFLSADFAIAFSLAQLPVPQQQLRQVEVLCSSESFESELAQENWNQVVKILSDCEFEQPGEIDSLVAILNNSIRSDAKEQQIIALNALRQLEENVAALPQIEKEKIAPDFSAELVAQLTNLLEATTLSWEAEAIAVEAAGAFAARVIKEEGSAELDLPALVNTLLALSEMESEIESEMEPEMEIPRLQVKISALQSLRNIGRALQAKGASADEVLSETENPWTEKIVGEMEAHLSSGSLEQASTSRVRPRLLTELRIARVEVLSAFLYTANMPFSVASRGIQFLNYLSAKAKGEILVRAAAIAELERLGAMEPYKLQVARELRHIALTDPDIDIRISAVEAMSRVEALPASSNWPVWEDELHRLRRLRGIALTDPDTDEETPSPGENGQLLEESLVLLRLLAIGLESSSTDSGAIELRQRAEIAFDQIYDQNLDQLVHAIRYAGASGNKAIQRNAVQALGAVNYRRLSESANSRDSTSIHLETLARFLGQSLLCMSDAEVRRDAAFALGQLAPHYPELLDIPLAPYWRKLLSDSPSSSFGEPLIEVCRTASQPDGSVASQNAEEWGEQIPTPKVIDAEEMGGQKGPKVMDALILRLDDREENIVVAASYALSRYGIALDSALKEAAFLGLPKDEAIEANLYELKTCMKALISPTRLDKWPEDASNDPMYQPLAALTEDYSKTCQYLLPEKGRNESAIAAAFILGQVGVGDGSSETSDDEQETVDFLLRALRGRDMLAQREFNRPVSPRPPWNESLSSPEYTYRVDSVRDSIVSYIFGQIHPREHGLIQQLAEAVTFPDKQQQRYDPSDGYVERALSCEDPTRSADDSEAIPVCIDDPITRAAVIGAIEYIGIERIDDTEPQLAQRQWVQAYLQRLRRLLTQDVDPVVTQAVVTTVVERVMAIAALTGEPDSTAPVLAVREHLDSLAKTDASAISTAADSPSSRAGNHPERISSIHENLAGTRYILSFPFTSLYSCAGAAYGLARLGVYNETTVDLMLNYLYAYPEPLSRPDAEAAEFRGNLCMPNVTQAGAERNSNDLPSRLEQLVIFKTGAIAALGAIELHDPQTTHIYRDAIARAALSDINGSQLKNETPDIAPEQIERVVTCLVNIANLEAFAPDYASSSPCQAPTNAETDEGATTPAAIPNSSITPGERRRARRLGFSPRQIEEAEEWGLTLGELKEAKEWGLTPSQRAQAKQYELTREEIEAGRELGLSIAQIVQAKKFGLTTEEVSEGLSRGILISEIIQAAKWGLTPQEFFALKLRLQEPAITALGQLAQTEVGDHALWALALSCPSGSGSKCNDRITGRSSANIRGLSFERLQALKLEHLEVALLHFQGSGEAGDQQKIDFIISEYLTPKLIINETDYQAAYNRENEEDLRVLTEEQLQERRERAKQLRERRERAEEFRDEVLKVLVSLDSETIRRLESGTLKSLVDALGVGRRPQALAQQCLSAEEDLLTQERLCHGVTKLLSAALSSPNASIPPTDAARGTRYLQTLATDPTNDDNSSSPAIVGSAIINSFEPTRSSPIIRSSAIEYLGEVEAKLMCI